MTVRPKTESRKYSRTENFKEKAPSAGAISSMAIALTVPPTAEPRVATPIASMPRPCLVSWNPSMAVAAEAGVPGVWQRIAVIEPP